VGQTIRVKFLVNQDGFGALTGMFVDDVQLTLRAARSALELHPHRGRARRRSHASSRLGTVEAGARERLLGLPARGSLPIQKALCFAYEVSVL
jgi:hypothetical protein